MKHFADIISRTTGEKPAPFNRRWHFDEDRRRHHGRRTWDPATLDALIDAVGAVEGLYPPDWSDPDTIRWRAAGTSRVAAEIGTDDANALRLTIQSRRVIDLAPVRKALGAGVRKLRSSGKPRYQVIVSQMDSRQVQAVGALISAALSIKPASRSHGATRSSPR